MDHGYSGGTDKRPGLNKLQCLVRTRQVDGVVVYKMDRLFRSLKHLVVTLDEWQALGVAFIATNDAIDFTTPSGRLLIGILGSLSEFEKSLLHERTMLGLDHARRQGKTLGRPKTRDDAQIVSLRNRGMSYTQIERELGCERSAIYRALKAVAKTTSKHDFQLAEKTRHEGTR